MEYSGLDVSEIQGSINWKSVSIRRIKFAMIRATYDLSGIDSQFETNLKNISSTNISPGAYHQSAAKSIPHAIQEAEHFINTIKPYKISYPLALKYENEAAMQIGKSHVTDIVMAFVRTIKNAKYHPIIYADIEWLKEYLNMDRLENTDIWICDPNIRPKIRPSYSKNVTIWQYSNHGRMPGIKGHVNLDISYIDYPTILNKRGLNNLNNNSNNNSTKFSKIQLNSDTCEPVFYTVEKGDTLRNIAKKTLGNADLYRSIMELNGLNKPLIYPGQTLRIPKCNEPNILLHRVKSGETLWKIAEKYLGYGPRYNEIMSLNGLTSDMIYAGQILKIPLEQQIIPETYTVMPGDTLWKIAQNLLGNGNRYAEIMNLNNLQNGNLRVGQKLNIPKK